MPIRWTTRRKRAVAIIACAGVLMALMGLVFVGDTPPSETGGPSDACGTVFTDAKLDAVFAGNPAGQDGQSWATAYIFAGKVTERHGWVFYHTTRHVIIRDSLFRELVGQGLEFNNATHVRIINCTFTNCTVGVTLDRTLGVQVINCSFVINGKGIVLDGAFECNITRNLFSGNTAAVKVHPSTSGNLLHLNTFTDNVAMAEEPAYTGNLWHHAGLGNYYGNYLAQHPAAILDGSNLALGDLCDPALGKVYVGSEPHAVSSKSWDPFPLVFLPATAPGVIINTPVGGAILGNATPVLTTTMTGVWIVAAWYSIGTGPTEYPLAIPCPLRGTITMNVTIDAAGWESLPDGLVNLTVSAQSIVGPVGNASVSFTKDTQPPALTVAAPVPASLHRLAPGYTLSVVEPNMDHFSCILGGSEYPALASGTIDGNAWLNQLDGPVTIRFRATDRAGNIVEVPVTIEKHLGGPLVSFTAPAGDTTYGNQLPVISCEVTDAAGVSGTGYYYVSGSLFPNPVSLSEGVGGTMVATFALNSSAFWALADGQFAVRVVTWDLLGNQGEATLILAIDRTPPALDVLCPRPGGQHGSTPAGFGLVANDSHLDDLWYSFDAGVTAFQITRWTGAGWAGYFDATEWTRIYVPGGQVTVSFFANDTLGNTRQVDVTISFAPPAETNPIILALGDPSTWLLAGILVLLGVLVHVHKKTDKRLEARLR